MALFENVFLDLHISIFKQFTNVYFNNINTFVYGIIFLFITEIIFDEYAIFKVTMYFKPSNSSSNSKFWLLEVDIARHYMTSARPEKGLKA